MKKITILYLILCIFIFCSCEKKKFSENDYNIIWNDFFVEEFKESLQTDIDYNKRIKILNKIAEKNNIDYNLLVEYMKTNHKDNYNKIFQNK